MDRILNIFENDTKITKNKEIIDSILADKNCRVESITSSFCSSPEGFWYDQNENELVFLCKGKAVLNIEGTKINLKKGDYFNIPAHKKHRIESTSKTCVWLCVFY